MSRDPVGPVIDSSIGPVGLQCEGRRAEAYALPLPGKIHVSEMSFLLTVTGGNESQFFRGNPISQPNWGSEMARNATCATDARYSNAQNARTGVMTTTYAREDSSVLFSMMKNTL
jgi:hypothetical protein